MTAPAPTDTDADAPDLTPDPGPAPGIYPDMPESAYFADRSALSASDAKTLLGRKPPAPSDAMDLGSAFHRLALDAGPEIAWIDADSWRTKAAREARDAARAAGHIPMLESDRARLDTMNERVRNHKAAAALLDYATHTEVSAFAYHHPNTNAADGAQAMVRGRFDILGDGYLADLKTTTEPDPDGFGRTAWRFGYHISAANYLEIATRLGLIEYDANTPAPFAFINVEKEPPYRVAVIELTADAIAEGRARMHEAVEMWLAHDRTVFLPDFGDGIHTVDLPPYAYRPGGVTNYQKV